MSALREIIARFGVSFDDNELKKGESSIDGMVEKLKTFGEAAAAAFAIHEIKEFVGGMIEQAGAIGRQAAVLGTSTAELQQWQYAAQLSHVSSEALTASLGRLSGGKYDKNALQQLGVSTKDANGELKSGTELMGDIAEALSNVDNPTKRNTLAMGALGRSYKEILPLLGEGREGIDKMRAEFVKMGGGFSEDFIKKSEDVEKDVTKLKTAGMQLGISIVATMLPAIRAITEKLVEFSMPIVDALKNSSAFEAGLTMLTVAGIGFLSTFIGPLGAALGGILIEMAPFIAAFLILEDIFTFFKGGDSAIGRLLDAAFGPGTQEKVRAWFVDVKNEVVGFFDDLMNRPQKLLDDWDVFTTELGKDLGALWDNFANKTGAVWDGIKLAVKIVATEIGFFFKSAFAEVQDAFISVFNLIMSYYQKVVGVAAKVASVIPGAGAIEKGLGDISNTLEGFKGNANNAEEVAKMHDREKMQIAREGDNIAARWNGTTVAPQLTNHVTVNVPPGTSHDMANKVGQAAAHGSTQGAESLRGTQAALVQGKG